MSRYHEERLPDGMMRVGYDADSQVYTFQDSDGRYWEGAPGCEHGQLTRISSGPPADDADDSEPFLNSDDAPLRPSWRVDLMPLLNFGVIIGLSLLLLVWYLRWSASTSTQRPVACPDHTETYRIKSGDTCWALGEDRGITVDDILAHNPGLNCDKLAVDSSMCLPK